MFSLQRIKLRGVMIEVYKMLSGLAKIDIGKMFVRDINVGRGYSYKLFQKRCQTLVRQRFFTNRVVNFWNSLTEKVVMNTNSDTFKNKLNYLKTSRGIW